VETDPTRVCELIVGLPEANVLGVEDTGTGQPWRLYVECRARGQCATNAVRWRRSRTSHTSSWLTCPPSGGRCGWRGAAPMALSQPGMPRRFMDRRRRRIASPRLGLTDRAGRWTLVRSENVDGRCPRWPASWEVTGTPSTTPSSPTERPSSTLTATGSARSLRSGWTRHSSPGSEDGDVSSGPRRSSTCAQVFSSTWCRVGAALIRPPGWPNVDWSGWQEEVGHVGPVLSVSGRLRHDAA